MQSRIRKILGSDVLEPCRANTVHTFSNIGLSSHEASEMWHFVVDALSQEKPLVEIERGIFKKFSETFVRNEKGERVNLPQSINEKLSDRARIIYDQIEPFLRGMSGNLLDFGCGNGKVAQLMKDRNPDLVVCGVDVADYKDPHVNVPIGLFDGNRVPVESGTVDCVVLTNVLHHEKDNQKCLDEVVRVLSPQGKAIIIETVPVGSTPEAIELDRERTFWNDLVYNRWLNDGDIPVPGTYETPEGWVDRVRGMGLEVVHTEDLGIDQPTIQDTHDLQVYSVGGPLRLIKVVEQALQVEGGDLDLERRAIDDVLGSSSAVDSIVADFMKESVRLRRDVPKGPDREAQMHVARTRALEQMKEKGANPGQCEVLAGKLSIALQGLHSGSLAV